MTVYHVEARDHAFPYRRRLVSGPFYTAGSAISEANRIRPFYPEAHLGTLVWRGAALKPPPERTPRIAAPGDTKPLAYSLATVAGRLAAAEALADYARSYGATVTVENWDGEPDVDVATASLRANIWLHNSRVAPIPTISWHSARWTLQPVVSGVWREEGRMGRKATSQPRTWPQLFDMLALGILASVDGTCFDLGT